MERSPVYAEVAVASDAPFRQAFSYRVPDGMNLGPGDGVLVPFGRQTLPGVVVRLAEHAAWEGAVRDVVMAGDRLLLPHQLDLAQWLADEYFAPLSSCIALMLPPAWLRKLDQSVSWNGGPAPEGLSPADRRLVERLRDGGTVTVAAL